MKIDDDIGEKKDNEYGKNKTNKNSKLKYREHARTWSNASYSRGTTTISNRCSTHTGNRMAKKREIVKKEYSLLLYSCIII